MRWFKHKSNLVHKVSNWVIEYKCHCGKYHNERVSFCKYCGCVINSDYTITMVITRMEWDVDTAKDNRYMVLRLYPWQYSNCSNVKKVEKPEGCQALIEEKPC